MIEHLAEGITLYLGDCREILPTLGKVDAAVTDPPYNSGLKYGSHTNDGRLDYWDWLKERIMLFWDNTDAILIKHSSLKIAQFLEEWPSSRVLVWSKPFSSGFPHMGFATHWEPLHLLKGSALNWSKDVFECNAGAVNKEVSNGHPAQMPEALAEWLIQSLVPDGGIVLDPFVGSGTTGVAAVRMGRKFIGIEIEPKYFEIACRRISEALKQPDMFIEKAKPFEQQRLAI